ncbi:hypothetical protein HDV01_001202 [Terramyces sp. JEL0728]|nr:hypothetical protein HDV01_001202 [Terramyces sp. JEL0728]
MEGLESLQYQIQSEFQNRPVSSDSTILSDSNSNNDRVSQNTAKSLESELSKTTALGEGFDIKSALSLLDSAIDNSDFLIDLFPEPNTGDSKIPYNRKSTLDNVDVNIKAIPLPPVQMTRSKSETRKPVQYPAIKRSNSVKKSVEPIAKTVGAIKQKVQEYAPFHHKKSEYQLQVGSPSINGNHMPHMNSPMLPLDSIRVASPNPSLASVVTSNSTLVPQMDLSNKAIETQSHTQKFSNSGTSVNEHTRASSPLASISQNYDSGRQYSSTLQAPRNASPFLISEIPRTSSPQQVHSQRAPSPISYDTFLAQKSASFDPKLPSFQTTSFNLPDFSSYELNKDALNKPAHRSKTTPVGARTRDSHLIISGKFKSEGNIRKDYGPSTAPLMTTELHTPQPSQLYYSPQFSTPHLDYFPPAISTSVVSKPPQIYSPAYAPSDSSSNTDTDAYASPFPFSQLANAQPARQPESKYTVSPIATQPVSQAIPPRNHKQVARSNQKSIFWCI